MRALLTLLLGSATLLTACGGGSLVINGRVLDHRGVALPKAEVATEPETDIVVTNQRGFFSLRQRLDEFGEAQPIKSGTYLVHVRKFGFKDVDFEVTVKKGEVKIPDLVMEPKTPDIGDAAPELTEERKLGADEGSTPTSGI